MQHRLTVPTEERRPTGKVVDGGPQLTGGCHGSRLRGGLGEQHIRERVDRITRRVLTLRVRCGAVHSQRGEDLAVDQVQPTRATYSADEFAQYAVTDVGVVEPGSRRVFHLARVEGGSQLRDRKSVV